MRAACGAIAARAMRHGFEPPRAVPRVARRPVEGGEDAAEEARFEQSWCDCHVLVLPRARADADPEWMIRGMTERRAQRNVTT